MDNNQRQLIEEKALSLAKAQIVIWTSRLEENGIEIEDISIARSGDETNYFSEIEFNLWKGNNIETFFSLIIFMEGKQSIDLNDVPKFIDDEIIASIEGVN